MMITMALGILTRQYEMGEENVTHTVEQLVTTIRDRWDRLGFFEGSNGAFATGHMPAIAPRAYLCRFYAGLSEPALSEAENESERHLPEPYREFLKSYNGAEIMGVALFGSTGGQNHRDISDVIGQPISIRYQNVYYTRRPYIPQGHFGIGGMNGKAYSQGQLYLTSTGEVELINRDHNLVAARWPSFVEFLKQETQRQMSRYDESGCEIKDINPLPGNTDGWEELGKEEHKRRLRENSFFHKVTAWLRSRRNF